MVDIQYDITIMGGREVFILLAMPPPSLERAALGVWGVWFKPRLEIRHATALTIGAKHWHRQKAVFYVFISAPQYLSTEPKNYQISHSIT